MQVISGKYRGRKLKSPDSARPTLQRIKISTFSLIQEFMKPDIKVLDLFAGSGALGLECISRGAKHCHFVEVDKSSVKCIESNLKGIDKQFYSILNTDYKDALKTVGIKNLKFDIIFLDPPYEQGFYAPAVDIIARYNLLENDGILVLEMNKEKPYIFDASKYKVYKERDYGISKILVLQKLVND